MEGSTTQKERGKSNTTQKRRQSSTTVLEPGSHVDTESHTVKALTMYSIKPSLSAAGLVGMAPRDYIVDERRPNADGIREGVPEVPMSTEV